MKSLVRHLILVLVLLELPGRLSAQSVSELKASIDSLRAEVATLRAGIESRLPPDGRTVTEYVNSAIAAAGAGGGGTGSTTGTVNIPGLGNGIVFHDGTVPTSPTHLLFAGGGDRGLRFLYNHRAASDGNPSYSDPSLSQLRLDFEQDGVLSMNYYKAYNAAAGPYDTLRGKALAFKVGGQASENGARGEFAQVYGGLVGRGLRIGVVDAGGVPNSPSRWGFQIKGDGSPNPVSVQIDGALQQLKSCNVGGVRVVCLSGGTASSPTVGSTSTDARRIGQKSLPPLRFNPGVVPRAAKMHGS